MALRILTTTWRLIFLVFVNVKAVAIFLQSQHFHNLFSECRNRYENVTFSIVIVFILIFLKFFKFSEENPQIEYMDLPINAQPT